MLRTLPCCFHPTTILFVDDDAHLLHGMSFQLLDHFLPKQFCSPVEALDFLKTFKNSSFSEACLHPEMDFKGTLKTLFNPHRFETISIAVVDFAMPDMTGVEFLERINTRDCKKVMFTGEAWNIEGLNIFNFNSIDRICRKSETSEAMRAIFEDMELRYFQEHTQALLSLFKHQGKPIPACLLDPNLIAPVLKKFEDKKIVEFYLVNHEGLFLTLQPQGQLEWFLLQSELEFQKNPHTYTKERIQTPTQNYFSAFFPYDPAGFPLEKILPFNQVV